jgi:diguanylate cyclase (GGDEF)-like protein
VSEAPGRVYPAVLTQAEVLDAVAGAIGDGVVVVDRQGHLLVLNPAADRLLGGALRRLFHDDQSPDWTMKLPDGIDARSADLPLAQALRGEQPKEAEVVVTHRGREPVTVILSARPIHGASTEGAVLTVHESDRTAEQEKYEERLRHLADHDPLTGLLNRRRFQEELALHQQRCLRYGPDGVLLLLDLDGFKDVNDTLGHAVGDQILRSVAAILLDRLRATDVVARLDGDEFAILLPRADLAEGERVAASIVARVQATQHTTPMGAPARVTATAGVAAFDGDGLDLRDVLAEADVALYEAKEERRGSVTTYSPQGQQRRIAQRMSWTERIREALEGNGFVLECQPVYDYAADACTRHELLLRMREPKGGLAPPARFLPVAEQFGSIREIDRWVLREAVSILHARPNAGGLLVNLSAASLVDPNLAPDLAAMFSATGVDPTRLTLEITETAAIAHMERARALAEQLRGLGCGLALDDFGAGFASFYYLKHLPVDVLKIDGEFIRDLARDAMSQAVVRAVVQTAAAVGRETIAECVEDDQAFELLRELGVDAAQGWHVGRPGPLEFL